MTTWRERFLSSTAARCQPARALEILAAWDGEIPLRGGAEGGQSGREVKGFPSLPADPSEEVT